MTGITEIYADGAIQLDCGTVATLVLNAVARKNAMNRAMWRALPEIAARITDDPLIRVVIVTGEGRAFSAGADISEFAEVYATPDSAAAYNAEVRAGVHALQHLPRPVIARISGPCIGGGVALALAADLRFASQGAVFAVPPARLGIAYSIEDTALLVAAVGSARAKDMLFSARQLSAADALSAGLVDRVLPEEDLPLAVRSCADDLSRLSGASIRQAKATVNALMPRAEDAALKASLAGLFAGDDFTEGRAAFLERRAPVFR